MSTVTRQKAFNDQPLKPNDAFAERPLSAKERETVLWLLQHGNPDAATFIPDVELATVVGVCPCGCATIDLAVAGVQPADTGMIVLSDYYWIDDDGHTNGIFVFSVSGQLAGLEVYSCDGESGTVELPDISQLRPMPEPQSGG
ncbi:hypothetical protein [Rhodopirellula sp. SWK7]|uniref:hypothetical protein n=1 Tax=Rhodopirellula sp. SWK7 TaxID=595460 RepID=UPI0002BFFB44|nr:hypothetical protein [Rhodopirellula sp. SWK7]EMI44878.1 hypothetical protein RRSWK_02611 [Rhodopirellula sp. SWK7]